jgi:prevent-host-death family protein
VPRQVSIAQASNSLSALVHDVETGPAVELTRRGKPVAILLSKASYEHLRPTSTDFWEAIQRFRSEVDLDEIDIDEALEGVRDRSPGRGVEI